ncbi:MAG TPA: BamA/TamA family outer membrane protein [Bryobacteraceae bacterium]|nr:BamA/TamA family outer membrane protein [Bryobacteraceae bacterium]
MKFVWASVLLVAGLPLLAAGTQDSEFNVNTRYTVEDVQVAGDGWTTHLVSDKDSHISFHLRQDLLALIGQKLNTSALDDVARRLRKEFRARTVERHVLRGKSPQTVQVVFDIEVRPARFDLAVPKFAYVSNQGWNGAGEATATIYHHAFTGGVVSDGDELLERYTGFQARYENTRLFTDRLHFRFEYDDYHELWHDRTRVESVTDLYRARQIVEPVLTYQIARPLSLSLGASFEQLQPIDPAAHIEAANAVILGAHFRYRTENAVDEQLFDSGYDLRSGAHTLASDFAYNRHHFEFRYTWTRGKQTVMDDAIAGVLTGRAPLYERFSLGNSSTLRGWNKYELDPLGGNRMLHNAVEYRYGAFQAFYDLGAIWDAGEAVIARSSIGAGIREGPFSIAVAIPMRDGRIEPVLIVGMNY